MKRYLFPLLGGGILGLALAAGGGALRAGDPAPRFVNPKVQPGLVHWHPSFEAACEAARRSGKPVLLFQMMGRLDQKFC